MKYTMKRALAQDHTPKSFVAYEGIVVLDDVRIKFEFEALKDASKRALDASAKKAALKAISESMIVNYCGKAKA